MRDLPFRFLGDVVYSYCENQNDAYHDYPDKLSIEDMIPHPDGEKRSESSRRPSSDTRANGKRDGVQRA